jgi:hypothetical protein
LGFAVRPRRPPTGRDARVSDTAGRSSRVECRGSRVDDPDPDTDTDPDLDETLKPETLKPRNPETKERCFQRSF